MNIHSKHEQLKNNKLNESQLTRNQSANFKMTNVLNASALSIALIVSMGLMANKAWAGPGHDHGEMSSVSNQPAPNQPTPSQTIPSQVLADLESSEAHSDDLHVDALVLSPRQQQLAGIQVVNLSNSRFNLNAVATATIVVDRDRTMTLAPQLDVRVLKRHVVPGQKVTQGQALLTLGGVAVAQAQADYITAAAELNRVKSMNASTVSASRRLTAEVQTQLARANLEALNMTTAQITALASQPASIGQFQLLAPINGRVQQDVAMLGQVSTGGSTLMQLTDESHLWVEAQLSAAQAEGITNGDTALVKVGEISVQGTIIGRSHELDSITRTEQVLVSINNKGVGLHAGQFAELYLPSGIDGGVVLPDAALTRSADGHWQVFIEDEDGFEAIEVEVTERQRGMNMVKGLAASSNIVISGAFLLASELAKAGFDIHNH
ncbi:efflux RND transporter periplasmic adaptor subunit [Shewanella goraebulensis]|uniref:efflux RND transporter periplasmic adaptor subunit n=1 Tax=Shewanella goraebulensis TaxID=3050637 RepID=UPI00254F27D2|nr:efflux RND transporter periplasmic adaptor subunit [Shewanella goraebulensis]